MPTRLILGHPYHGAFYWLSSAEAWRRASLKSAPKETHPYYRTLYGRAPHAVVDELVSLCLLYDEVYLAPADCPLPDWRTKSDGRRYHHDELGILSDWSWEGDQRDLDDLAKEVMAEFHVQEHLRGIPPTSRPQIIRTAIVQLRMRESFGADLLAGPSHLRLCERISYLICKKTPITDNAPAELLRGLRTVFETASLRFSIDNLDEFVTLRSAKALRQYATSFRAVIDALPTGSNVEYAIYKAMTEAIDSSDIAGRVSGGLNIGASLSGIASLIPIVGTIAGVVGLTADGASRFAKHVEDDHKWWTLAPTVSTLLTRARIKARFKDLERAKHT